MFDSVGEKIQEIFQELLLWLFESLITPFADLRMIHTLIFGRDENFSTVWGTFRPDELSAALGPIYYTMMGLAGIVILALIGVNGMRISASGRNPQTRTTLVDFLKDLLFVGIILVNLPLVYDLLFAVNLSIVELFSSAYDSQSLSVFAGSFEAMVDAEKATDPTQSMGIIGAIFVYLILIGLTLWANVYYLMRKVTLVILMALGPVMIAMWLLPQFKGLTGAWFRELIGSIFVQAIHAFTFWTVAAIALSESSFVGTVIVYVLFIPISESLRRLLSVGGDMQGGLSKTASMFGMAGIAGIAGSVKGALQDKSVMQSLKEGYDGVKGSTQGKDKDGAGNVAGADDLKNTVGASPGSDVGSDTKAEKMLKTGDIFSKGGKAVLGAAGSIVGMPLGPVGAMTGAAAGFGVGGVIGGVGGRAGAALAQGVGSRLAKGKEAAQGVGKGDSDELAASIADSETANWASENKDSVMADLKERFPDATPADLEKKFDGIQQQKRAGFYQNAQSNFKQAKEAAKDDALGKDLASSSAIALADKWGENNQKAFMDQYNQENPQKAGEPDSSYQARRLNTFNDKKGDMREKFQQEGIKALNGKGLDEPMSKAQFTENLNGRVSGMEGLNSSGGYAAAIDSSVKGVLPKEMALGKDLANSSAAALTNNWAAKNKDPFMKDYDQQNPQQEGESDSAYQERRNGAFNAKKSDMNSKFHNASIQALDGRGMDDQVSKVEFKDNLSGAVAKIEGVSGKDASAAVILGAISNVKGTGPKETALGKDLATSSATALTNNWASQNKDSFMRDFDQQNPQQDGESNSAYQERRTGAFNAKKAAMHSQFQSAGAQALGGRGMDEQVSKADFEERLGNAVTKIEGAGSNHGAVSVIRSSLAGVKTQTLATGKDLANSSADSLTNTWADSNKDSFMKNYAQSNPQQVGESNTDYQNRSTQAFNAKKADMRNAFHGAAVSAAGGTEALNNSIDTKQFAQKLGSNIQQVEGVSNGFQSTIDNSVNSLPGMQMFSQKGKPNVPYIASGMANAAVRQQRDNFVANQVSQGVDGNTALQNWNQNHAQPTYQKALETYNDAISNVGDSGSLVRSAGPIRQVGSFAGQKLSQATAFAGASTGVTGFAKGASNFATAVSNGSTAAGTSLVTGIYGTDQGNVVANGVKSITPSLRAGYKEAVNTMAESKGGAVNAQADLQNNVGYATAILGGAGGYRVGKSIASKFSPYKGEVQQAISSPGEVMQMAQTFTDDRGNKQIAPGAVRQVITPDESYIEVKTNSGENRIVSRKGAGHPGLGKGQAVYQDLQMQNDTLVATKPNGLQTSTYQLDSGGGRIPSNVAVQQNPNALLGSPQRGAQHRAVQRQNAPLYNQAVDSGNFYVEDLDQANMSNVQVVVEKDRQFVTAQKDGTTYRVSPVYSGDSRLGTSESRTIPVSVSNGTLKPKVSENSQVAVVSNINDGQAQEDYYTSKSLGGMLVGQQFEELMPGKQYDRIKRAENKRAQLDAVRRKQGLLG